MTHLKTMMLILWMLVTLSIASMTHAQEATYGIILENNVVVRIGPDFAYGESDQIPRDTSVVVLGRAPQWIYIQYGENKTGWVLQRMVRMGKNYSSLPRTALNLPRDGNGRVPEGFDLSSNVCDQWQGDFTQTGDFMAGDAEMTVTYPAMPGATNYIIIIRSPQGRQRTLDSKTTSLTFEAGALNWEAGSHTWSVVPIWNITANPFRAQEICIERIGGTFEKPDTTPQ